MTTRAKLWIFFPLTLLLTLAVSGWSQRPAINKVSTARIAPTSSTVSNGPVPTYFTYYVMGSSVAGASVVASVGASVQGVVMTGLSNKGYSHIMVANNQSTEIALSNVQSGIQTESVPKRPTAGVPSNVTDNTFYVLGSNTAAWDDVSIYDTLFIRSVGSSITSGNIDITVW